MKKTFLFTSIILSIGLLITGCTQNISTISKQKNETIKTEKELKPIENEVEKQTESIQGHNVEKNIVDENFIPDWFSDSQNEFRGKSEGQGFPVYTNNRLCFQITLPDYAKNYEAIVNKRATNLIDFMEKDTKPNQYDYYGRWFSIGRMSEKEYEYFFKIESRGPFSDSKVIGKTDEYVYLLQDVFVSQLPKTEKITAEELKFKIIDCK